MRFDRELAGILASLLRDNEVTVHGFKLTDVRLSKAAPSIIVCFDDESGQVYMTSINVVADTYSVMPALKRSDVRTPGPASGPMVPELRYWYRPHTNALGEPCNGVAGDDGECEEDDCIYNGEEEDDNVNRG